jgi:X-X-X-Leu-X-X-Gly heptad repeat protein
VVATNGGATTSFLTETPINDGLVRINDGSVRINDGSTRINDGSTRINDGPTPIKGGPTLINFKEDQGQANGCKMQKIVSLLHYGALVNILYLLDQSLLTIL